MKNHLLIAALVSLLTTLSGCGENDDNPPPNDNIDGIENPPAIVSPGQLVINKVVEAMELETAVTCDDGGGATTPLRISQGIAMLGNARYSLFAAVSLELQISRDLLNDFGVTTARFVTNAATPAEPDGVGFRVNNAAQLERLTRFGVSGDVNCTPVNLTTMASPVFALEPAQRIKALYAISEDPIEQVMQCTSGPAENLPSSIAYRARLAQSQVVAIALADPLAPTLRFDVKPIGTYTSFTVPAERSACFSSTSNLGNVTELACLSPSGKLAELSRITQAAQRIQERCE